MPYFDLTEDGGKLSAAAKESPDLELVANEAEFDLFQFYTGKGRDYSNSPYSVRGSRSVSASVVYLLYYEKDPDDLTTPDQIQFRDTVKRAIAKLINLRVSEDDDLRNVKRVRTGRLETEYFQGGSSARNTIPKAVQQILKQYDNRRPV